MSRTKTLKLCYWNADGISGKKNELKAFLQEEQIDVLLIGEIWLNVGYTFKLPNYKIYRPDRADQPGNTHKN